LIAQPLTEAGRAHQAQVARFRVRVPTRDSQRSRVYAAERLAHGGTYEGGPDHPERLDGGGMQAQLDAMVAAHGVPCTIRWRRIRGANAETMPLATGGYAYRINVGDGWLLCRNSTMIPHEYAHILCAAAARGPAAIFTRDPWHHSAWCAVYLALLARHVSPEVAEKMRCAFEAKRVCYAESPTVVRRVLNIEQENRT
jgi:hypothetical protein